MDHSPKSLLAFSQFLHRELPIRFASRAKQLMALPYNLCVNPNITIVRNMYMASFMDLVSERAPETIEEEKAFINVLIKIHERHSSIVPILAKAVHQLLDDPSTKQFVGKCPYIQEFLDKFYFNRIGVRVLLSHHIALHGKQLENHVGIFDMKCSPVQVVNYAVSDATRVCNAEYSIAPDVNVYGDMQATLSYVPSHLHHVLYEIIKNAMRAVVERYPDDHLDLPEIDIVVAEGEDDFAIKISDQGGGIPRSAEKLIWSYLHTTAKRPDEQSAMIASVGALCWFLFLCEWIVFFFLFVALCGLMLYVCNSLSLSAYTVFPLSFLLGDCDPRSRTQRCSHGWFRIWLTSQSFVRYLFWRRSTDYFHGGLWDRRLRVSAEVASYH